VTVRAVESSKILCCFNEGVAAAQRCEPIAATL
jgi:hypothetical protein